MCMDRIVIVSTAKIAKKTITTISKKYKYQYINTYY